MNVRKFFAAMMKPELTTMLVVTLVTLSLALAGPIAGAIGFALFTVYFVVLSLRYRHFVGAVIILGSGAALVAVFVAGSAWADTVAAPAPVTFSLAPIVDYLGPSIVYILTWLVGTVLSLLIGVLVKWLQQLHINVDTSRFDVIKASAQKIVSAWFATQTASIAARTYTTDNSTVKTLVDMVEADVLPFIQKLGLNRAQLAVFVQAEIGKLQTALLPSLGSAAVVAPNPPPAVQK